MIKPAVKYGEACPFCGHEGELKKKTLELWYVECEHCEAKTGLYDHESDALDAWNDRVPLRKKGYWVRSQEPEANVWQCMECGEEWQLEDGTPEEHHMNYCHHCGARLFMHVQEEAEDEAEAV